MSGRAWREAEVLERERRWGLAGAAWQAIADRAWAQGDIVRTRDAASRAGDAWRREDRPMLAARALKLAWDAGRRGPMDAALLAAVLLDAGQPDVALDLVQEVEGADDGARAVLLDVRLGLEVALGQVDRARADLDALDALEIPGATIARVFRQAQVDRLEGLLERADQGFAAAAKALAGMDGAAGPRAAALGERGELALLCAALGHGEALDAVPALEAALDAWRAAGREGPALRAEAWLLRARRLAGQVVLVDPLRGWIAGAAERGLPLLAADLQVSYAVASGDPAGLGSVLDALERAPLARGRVRVIAAELGGDAHLDAALDELQPDAPWFARALLAVGRRDRDDAVTADAKARIAAFFPPVDPDP